MFNKTYIILFTVLLGLTMVSCVDDLSTTPLDDDVVTSESVYETPEDYKQVLAKLYAGFSMTGQQGPAGNADIQGIDEGFSSYIRQYFTHQQNPTDETIIGWGDEGLPEFNYLSWTASNDFIMGMYSRIYYEIAMTNEFIRNAEGREEAEIQAYVAEARFLRALSYWHALDLFGGNVPFVTEEDVVGSEPPMPTNADDLFAFIESELLDIVGTLPAPGSQDYGRADRGAAWMLLAKLYLNAEVYVGQDRYDDALTYAENVSDAYQLHDNYQELFMADNHTADGIIFPITFDGVNTTGFGGTHFIIHAQVGGNMDAADFAIDGGWGGNRVTPEFVSKFADGEDHTGYQTPNSGGNDVVYVPGGYQAASGYTNDWSPADAPTLVSENNDGIYSGHVYFNDAAEFKFTVGPDWSSGEYSNSGGDVVAGGGDNFTVADGGLYYMMLNTNTLEFEIRKEVNLYESRDMFFTDGQTLEVDDVSSFSNGYAVEKWTNKTSDGGNGSALQYVDTDFPMFRLADAYLMYAEAVVRGAAGGDINKAVGFVNDLRFRAYGDNSGDITSGELTLDFIIDERSRELYWEGHRRTDLRRFGLYTSGDYVWAWKGGTQEGESVSDIYEIFPIPSSDVNANPNLTQNPGY